MVARRIEGWKLGLENGSYEDRRMEARRIGERKLRGWKL